MHPGAGNTGRLRRLACVLALALTACGGSGRDYEQRLYALGTEVTLRLYDTDDGQARAAGAELERLYAELGRDWYPWYDGPEPGELQRINDALEHGETVAVSPALAALLQRADALRVRSGGLFDAGLGRLTQLWGFNQPLQVDWRPPDPTAVVRLHAALANGGGLHWQGRRLSSDSRAVVLDPGGIAKGAILTRSIEVLERHGIDNAIVDLGGDLTVSGSVHGRAARIGIRDPAGGAARGWLELADGETVVTSGNYERYFEFAGRRYAHILDPRTGYPAEATASVTVVSRDAVLADAAATALLVAGRDEFAATCRKLGIDLALLIDTGGDLSLTSSMRDRVHWSERGAPPAP